MLAQVLGECLIVVMPGSMIGMAISVGGSRFMRSLLFQVSATDPFSFGLAAALVLALCLLSVAVPALKAARVDPSEVLRAE